jgi:hypothetical protein
MEKNRDWQRRANQFSLCQPKEIRINGIKK